MSSLFQDRNTMLCIQKHGSEPRVLEVSDIDLQFVPVFWNLLSLIYSHLRPVFFYLKCYLPVIQQNVMLFYWDGNACYEGSGCRQSHQQFTKLKDFELLHQMYLDLCSFGII